MKSLAVMNYIRWSLVLSAVAFATPVSAQTQYPGGRQPLNQLPPIISPNGQLSDEHRKKNLFLPPIVQGNNHTAKPQAVERWGSSGIGTNMPLPTTAQPALNHELPPIVQGGDSANSNQQPLPLPPAMRQISSAGVPLYASEKSTVNNADFSGQLGTNVGQVAFKGFPQGSGTRNVPSAGDLRNPLPPIVSPDSLSPGFQQSQSRVPDMSGALAPMQSTFDSEMQSEFPMDARSTVMETPMGARSIASPEIISSMPIPNGSAAPGMQSSGIIMPGSNDYFSTPQQPISGGQLVDTGCSSCGQGGCYNLNQVQNQFGCCGSVVSAGYYVFADALVWTRGDGDLQFSNFFGLNQFSYDGGFRFTLGYRENATQGREFTYFGTGDISDNASRTSGNNSLGALFAISNSFGLGNVNGFTTAGSQDHTKSTSVHSLEYSKVKWGWDVLKTMIGVRYLYFDDNTRFFSTNGLTGQNGLFTMDSVNNLFGVTGGFEMFYDVGYRTSFSFSTKGGAYINSANVDTNLFNFGQHFLDQDEDDATIASTIELNVLSHFQLKPKARFRLGYDLMLLWGLFTVENNAPRNTFARGNQTGTPFLSPLTGTDLNTNNEPVIFHGLSFGFEYYR